MFLGFHLLASENLFDDTFFVDDESGADGAPFLAQQFTIVANESPFKYTIIQKTLKKALFRGRGTGNQGNKHYLCMILCTPACVCRSYCLWACVASAE